MDQILEANAMQGRIDELLDAASYNRDRMARLESERDEALARYEAVADALGYVNHADGQGGRDVADPDTIIAAFRALERCADELREALDEREADMHMRIRAGYDKTVADCWRAKVAEVERERDEARAEVLRTVRELNDSRTETEQAAATERAKIVLYLTGRQYAAHRGDDAARARAFDDAARAITRLDHHRDGGTP